MKIQVYRPRKHPKVFPTCSVHFRSTSVVDLLGDCVGEFVAGSVDDLVGDPAGNLDGGFVVHAVD